MAYGVNRAAPRPKSVFRTAGGTIMQYRHPFLKGQIGKGGVQDPTLDEIDVSKALQLNATFFNAVPAQDNAVMEVLVDGSTITVTNSSLAGSTSLQVLPGSGIVGEGDLIAAAHLVIGSKDSLGGTFTVKEFIGGRQRTTVFYGVGWRNVPHLILAGNSLVPYPITLVYSGWVQGVSVGGKDNLRTIWAVGNKYGLTAQFEPYAIQNGGDAAEAGTYPDATVVEDAAGADFNAAQASAPAVPTGVGSGASWKP